MLPSARPFDRVGQGGGGSGIPVYPKKLRQNTQNSSKYTHNYTQVYFIPEIQRKWYTNIPYTRFKNPLYTVYPKTLADPALSFSFAESTVLRLQVNRQTFFVVILNGIWLLALNIAATINTN